MYEFQLIDLIMAGVFAVLILTFAVSLTHSLMKEKVRVYAESFNNIYAAKHEWYLEQHRKHHITKRWMDAVINLCVINHISWDETNPEATLAFLMMVETNMALDPAVSQRASALINKAKREHGKKVRKAADRKLERTERDFEARLKLYKDSLESEVAANNIIRGNCENARAELSAFQSIVSQELDNYIHLPSVRNACLRAINTNHKAWQGL